jgi:hypothetical protein
MLNYPQPTDDIIDSRDVIAAIEELESEFEDGSLDIDDIELLEQLKAFAEEGETCADWNHGETLIHEDYFKTYAQDLAEDVGAINSDASWPLGCIDWDQAADELLMDYTAIEFDDNTFYARA